MPISDPRIVVDRATLMDLKNKAKRLTLYAKFKPDGIFSGQNSSKFRGQGLSFEELRTYRTGDNIKDIDWKASMRANGRVTKVFTQETDRPALVLCDQRANMFFGSQRYMKSVVAAQLATLIAWLLHLQGDRVGGITMGANQTLVQYPSRTTSQILRYISDITTLNQALRDSPKEKAPAFVPLQETLTTYTPLLGSSGTLVLVIDGLALTNQELDQLKRLSIKHNVMVFLVTDLLEQDYQSASDLLISDGSKQIKLDNNAQDILRYQTASNEHFAKVRRSVHHSGLPFGLFNTVDEPYLQLSQLLREGG
ncbi:MULTISPECIES: DUF58 domain-containing protein [Vibrio]|uniref:DUF58 domain-containing protein n=1 Tax=Vibrio mediterranei TaxID=689 RepID=A0A3G4V919_9VIBR|nr:MULTISPECIES: DUF58 domain-containing protein [Vibrio]AYV20092.1 DUF58 domain-containing protein [Vibrio mediterranei]USD99287.1 DUF58 domain-containing protein [Vibrio sp. SCSIO 43133]